MEIDLSPPKITSVFLAIVAILTIFNVVGLIFYFTFGGAFVDQWVRLFDFAIEGNVPTFYSAFAILVCSLLLAKIAQEGWDRMDGRRYFWLALSLLFLFLALDEVVAIHERIGTFLTGPIEAEGYFYFVWVVPYGIATLVIGLIFWHFVWNLPKQTRFHFITAAIIFLAGAIGLEMLGAREADLNGTETIFYSVLYTLEELMEMLGIVLFMYALLGYLKTELSLDRLRF